MGKRMTLKKKSQKPVTQYDLNKAQKIIDKELAEIRTESTQYGTLISQELIYGSMADLGYTIDQIAEIEANAERIADRIADPNDEYGFDDVDKMLAEIGVNIER